MVNAQNGIKEPSVSNPLSVNCNDIVCMHRAVRRIFLLLRYNNGTLGKIMKKASDALGT
jgi:hypothetical protein